MQTFPAAHAVPPHRQRPVAQDAGDAQLVSQQEPVAQVPLTHSAPLEQLPPFAFLGSHAVPLHQAAAAQSAAVAQLVLQLDPTQL